MGWHAVKINQSIIFFLSDEGWKMNWMKHYVNNTKTKKKKFDYPKNSFLLLYVCKCIYILIFKEFNAFIFTKCLLKKEINIITSWKAKK